MAANLSTWSHKAPAENFHGSPRNPAIIALKRSGDTQWRGCKTRTAVYSIAAVSAISLALRLVEIAAALIDGIGHVARAPTDISH